MSLLRLLTAGKSLVGLNDYRSRYVSREGALPKFGSKKNPFRATTRPDFGPPADAKRPISEGCIASTPTNDESLSGRETGADSIDDCPAGVEGTAANTENHSSETLKPAQKVGVASARMDTSFDWGKVLFWRRSKPVRQAVPRFGKPMVQGELSLEGVRVVRNDLSDTDLEIVPAKPLAPFVTETPAKGTLERGATVETAWGRMTGRIFGAGKL